MLYAHLRVLWQHRWRVSCTWLVGCLHCRSRAPSRIGHAVRGFFFSDTRKSCLPRGFSLGEGAYHLRWLLRAWQLVEMRAKGSRRLRIDAEVTAIQLADVTADQHSWIRRVARPREKAVALIKRLQYTDAPEHLSMWWCVFCSVLPFVDPTWLESHVQRLVQLATAYEGKYGLPPHPLTLISLATGKSDMA